MSWIVTFLLGFIAGAVGAVMFVTWYGRRISEEQAANTTRTTVDGVFDGNGNPIPEDDPRYKEAVESVLRTVQALEEKYKSGGN